MSKVLEQKKMAHKEAPEKNSKKNTGKDKTVNRKNEKNDKGREDSQKDENTDTEKNEKEQKRGRQ